MAWPSTISQKLSREGYGEEPFDNTIKSTPDQGVPKIRRKYTGKMRSVRGSIWLDDDSAYNTYMTFYYTEAAEGAAYFTFDDQHGGTMPARIAKMSVSSRGAGWLLFLELEEKPHA
jgi:hypothetical protein